MSDRYLCKAKRVDNREWVKGLPSYDINGNITELEIYKGFADCEIVEIDPSTICKCTGKEYMDGEIAYEGDIYENPECGIIFVLKYGTYEAYCPADRCYMDNVGFYAEAAGYPQMPIGDLKDYGLKRGNIFDNPELLEGGTQ